MSHKRSFAGGLIAGIVLTLFLGCGYFAGTQLYRAFQAQRGAVSASGDSQEETSVANPATMQKMGVLEEMIGEYYLEDAEEPALEQGVYKGMIEALGDPYSTYYSQ